MMFYIEETGHGGIPALSPFYFGITYFGLIGSSVGVQRMHWFDTAAI